MQLATVLATLLGVASTATATPLASLADSAPVHLAARQGTGAVIPAAGLAFYDSNFAHGTAGYANPNTYHCFGGPPANFPAISTWMSFNNLWPFLKAAAIIPIGDTPAEATDIYNAIVSISSAAKVDARVILAVIILESTGKVTVACTNNGVENCGLMQSHAGRSFNASAPAASITGMIRDGTQGTPPPANGPGLVQYFNDAPSTFVTTGGNLWKVLRGYNSGAINPTALSRGLGASPSYVSDVANFLLGWHGWGNNSVTMKCGFTQ